MNKKSLAQLVPVIIIAAIAIFVAIVFVFVQNASKGFGDNNTASLEKEIQQLTIEADQAEQKAREEQAKMKTIKPIFQSAFEPNNPNLGIFGNMFENIIEQAQNSGLLIRSIEYEMQPASDPLYAIKPNEYNVCRLKFFFVGTYQQLLTFLTDINDKFQYLSSISKMNVTAFSGNTDYLLINLDITLYSKKNNLGAISDESNSDDSSNNEGKSKKNKKKK
ncbi:MAG: hypothetical protein LUG16_02185 [Candidatus Gastranaerophilales bacterium]|nr:hypothetical protein [Candidatus Gastranaerophilales bacterium]